MKTEGRQGRKGSIGRERRDQAKRGWRGYNNCECIIVSFINEKINDRKRCQMVLASFFIASDCVILDLFNWR